MKLFLLIAATVPSAFLLIIIAVMLIEYLVEYPDMLRQLDARKEALRLEKIAMLEKAITYANVAKSEENDVEKAYFLACAFSLYNIVKGSEKNDF